MIKQLKFSLMALVLFTGASWYAQAEPGTLHDGTYHQMTPDPKTPHVSNAHPQGPRLRDPKVAPEIDPSLAWSGISLLAGSLAVIGSRRKKMAVK